MKRFLYFVMLALTAFSLSAAKPVGLFYGNSWERVGELLKATLFNPQWTHDKPAFEVIGKKRDFSKYAAVVYLYGFNKPIAFREWSAADLKAAENYVKNGGVILMIFDGSLSSKSASTGSFSGLLGAKNYGSFEGKAEISDPAWQNCGKIPLVFKMMLGGNKYVTLKNLTTAKMIAGNKSGALISVNHLGRGKVYFINVRLTHSAVNYRRPGSGAINADMDQLFPFIKKFHAILMETKCAVVKDKRELWSYVPTGPKVVHDENIKPVRKTISSARKYEKLDGTPLTLVENGENKALFMTGRGLKEGLNRLNRVVELISGATIPYVAARSVKAENGKWKYRGKLYNVKISYVRSPKVSITASGNTITIAAPSVSIGVHTLMREAMGYRVLWPGDCGEVYTKSKNITIEPFKLEDAPFFCQRRIRNSLSKRWMPWKSPSGKVVKLPMKNPGAYLRLGMDPVEIQNLRSDHGGTWFAARRLGTHGREVAGSGTFYPWKKRFLQSKPEYFALQFNGTRHQRTDHVRICKSNPEVIKQVVEDARKTLDKRKNVSVYNVSPCDGGYDTMCRCPNCRAWDASDAPRGATRVYLGRNRPMYPYVSSSDRVFRFTCEVARRLKESHPKVKVGYLAYAGYLAPPWYYRDFPDNISVTFVGLNYLNKTSLERYRRYWDFWARVSDELILRPNYLLGGAGLPLLYMHEMAKDLRYCAETGMVGSDFDSLVHNWATTGLNLYVLGEMLWDPAQNVDDIIDEYCRIGFGEGAEAMKKYFLHCEKLTGRYAEINQVTLEQIEDITVQKKISGIDHFSLVFTDAEMKKLAGFIDEARKLTKAGSMERKRVDFVGAGLEFTQNRIDFNRAFRNPAIPAAKKRELANEQHKYWVGLFRKHPYAIDIPRLIGSQYLGYWRKVKWTAPNASVGGDDSDIESVVEEDSKPKMNRDEDDSK